MGRIPGPRHHSRALLLVALALSVAASAEAAPNALIYGLTSGSALVTFRSDAPGTILSSKPVAGIAAPLVGIDFRPSTGQLYGLTKATPPLVGPGQLYVIDPLTAEATAVGAPMTLDGTHFGFGVDPVADRIRVVSNNDQNLIARSSDGVLTQLCCADPAQGDVPVR
ncbi:MAG: DUF4394 domain-containing protein [Candidatus Rokuibacteriota bacterium]